MMQAHLSAAQLIRLLLHIVFIRLVHVVSMFSSCPEWNLMLETCRVTRLGEPLSRLSVVQ